MFTFNYCSVDILRKYLLCEEIEMWSITQKQVTVYSRLAGAPCEKEGGLRSLLRVCSPEKDCWCSLEKDCWLSFLAYSSKENYSAWS